MHQNRFVLPLGELVAFPQTLYRDLMGPTSIREGREGKGPTSKEGKGRIGEGA